jgi:hypothetical protein
MTAHKRRAPLAGGASAQSGTDTADSTAPASESQQPGFVVIESKSSGREAEVARCETEAEALSVVRLFRWAGAVVRVAPAP